MARFTMSHGNCLGVRLCIYLIGLLVIAPMFGAEPDSEVNSKENATPRIRLAGEFEPQRAILISVSDWQPHHRHILTELVDKTAGHTPLVVLVNSKKQLGETLDHLDASEVNFGHVLFHELELDTVWLRDFGPRIAQTSRGTASLDFYYNGVRPKDDKLPETWARRTDAFFKAVPWTLQGGNLIANGKGMAVTTNRIFDDNYIRFAKPRGMNVEFERRKIVVDAFKESCNINELVILEPLQSEATKHVDMFAMFLAPDRILVSQLDPRIDRQNADILNRNARTLAALKVDGKPMRVERIAIPPREGKFWSPYTNVIMTNDLLLFPTYQNDDSRYVDNAKRVFQRLLPRHTVETIDMTSMKKLEGALHCLSLNIPQFAPLPPNTLNPEQARAYLGGKLALTPKNSTSNSVPQRMYPLRQMQRSV